MLCSGGRGGGPKDACAAKQEKFISGCLTCEPKISLRHAADATAARQNIYLRAAAAAAVAAVVVEVHFVFLAA